MMESTHNTFSWTPERVRFMADAAAYGTFPQMIARAVADAAQGRTHICDAACGTGWLALELAKDFPKVTAVDASAEALTVLREMPHPQNLEPLQADLFAYTPPQPFDAMVFCFFGAMEQTLSIARRCCRGTVVLIKRAHPERQFAAGTPHRNTTTYAEDALAAHGIPYSARMMTVEMGQPLRTEADALRYLRAYAPHPEEISPDAVLPQLRPLPNHPDFRFYLPRKREIGLITFETSNIQEVFA